MTRFGRVSRANLDPTFYFPGRACRRQHALWGMPSDDQAGGGRVHL
jgi:hypothetical protein